MQSEQTSKKPKIAVVPPPPQPMSAQQLSANGMSQQMKKAPSSPSDSAGGSSCHQCKSRRTFNDLTYCTSHLDKKKKSCRKKYCEHCMQKFYKESPQTIDKNKWRCPSCRKICCCAACRRKEERKAGISSGAGANGHMPGPNGSMMPQSMPQQNAGYAQQQQQQQHSHNHMNSGVAPMQHQSLPPSTPSYPPPANPADYTFDVSPAELERSAESMAGMADYISSQAQNQCFSLLYAVANLPNVNKHIQYYLARKDITDGQKVESIANLLRSMAPRTS